MHHRPAQVHQVWPIKEMIIKSSLPCCTQALWQTQNLESRLWVNSAGVETKQEAPQSELRSEWTNQLSCYQIIWITLWIKKKQFESPSDTPSDEMLTVPTTNSPPHSGEHSQRGRGPSAFWELEVLSESSSLCHGNSAECMAQPWSTNTVSVWGCHLTDGQREHCSNKEMHSLCLCLHSAVHNLTESFFRL